MYVVLREIFSPQGEVFISALRDFTDNTVTLPVLRVFHSARDAGFEPETVSSVVWSATTEPSHLFRRAGIPLPSHRWRPRPGREQPPSPPCRSSSGSLPLQSKLKKNCCILFTKQLVNKLCSVLLVNVFENVKPLKLFYIGKLFIEMNLSKFWIAQ